MIPPWRVGFVGTIQPLKSLGRLRCRYCPSATPASRILPRDRRQAAMRVLVTGATGFIGRSAIAVLAEQGWEVHAVARSACIPQCARLYSVDLMDPGAVRLLLREVAPSHLLHLA